jgi:uncharacterized membrane protein YbhN (UPF0104 family)
VAALVWVFSWEGIDLGDVVAELRPRTLAIVIPALLLYGAVTLWLEALALRSVLVPYGATLQNWTAARIKAASYLAYAIHYGLGAGALSVLLRRRAGLRLAEAAGAVMAVALFDLALVLLFPVAGALVLGLRRGALRFGVIAAVGLSLVAAVIFLRIPIPLGPLERLRRLAFFDSLRVSSGRELTRLFVLRALYLLCFLAVGYACLRAFGLVVPVAIASVYLCLVALVAVLPIAVSGLGTVQAAFAFLFRAYGPADLLVACSLILTVGLIALRVGMGLLFAREFAREAVAAAQTEAA